MPLNIFPSNFVSRFQFAARLALWHLAVSLSVVTSLAVWVWFFLYPAPFGAMQEVNIVFGVLIGVDAVCGPFLTLLLGNPLKSIRERWIDLSFVGFIQLLALVYGLHSLWVARPVVLAFEVDRLVVVTANEVQIDELSKAAEGMRQLPWQGILKVNTRKALDNEEYLQSMDMGLAGVSPSMRPSWWLPWHTAHSEIAKRAKPLKDLIQRRPQDALKLQGVVASADIDVGSLYYLPLTSSKTKEWVALFDEKMEIVLYASVDGFE
jgi:hypothetical protein